MMGQSINIAVQDSSTTVNMYLEYRTIDYRRFVVQVKEHPMLSMESSELPFHKVELLATIYLFFNHSLDPQIFLARHITLFPSNFLDSRSCLLLLCVIRLIYTLPSL